MKMSSENNEIVCSFCGKRQSEVNTIAGHNGVYICDECVSEIAQSIEMQSDNPGAGTFADDEDFFQNQEEFQQFLQEQFVKMHGDSSVADSDYYSNPADAVNEPARLHKEVADRTHLKKPKEIYEELSDYVVGQEDAKRKLSIAVYNHYKRIFLDDGSNSDVEIQIPNVMLLGPTGSGKTLLAQSLAKIIQVPFAIADATTLTEAGYVGDDVENILRKLLISADWNVEEAEIGIVYVDEIDKIAKKGDNVSLVRDVSGEGVQQALLKIIEGCEVSVPPQGGRKHPQQDVIDIDTKNILFIFGGAFVGLSDIISKRLGKKGLGFTSDVSEINKQKEADLLQECTPEDLKKFGLIPEFIGRVPVVTSLDELDVEALVRILTEPKNALVKQYKRLFEIEKSELAFDDDALTAIAEEAKDRGTGARGLRAIVERVLSDAMFEVPDFGCPTFVRIRKSDVEGETKPEIVEDSNKLAENELGNTTETLSVTDNS